MRRVLLYNVRVGILDDNGKFRMSPFIQNIKTCIKGMQSENDFESKVVFYEVADCQDEILVKIITLDGKEYIIKSFSAEYIEYLNKMYFSLTELMNCYKQKEIVNSIGCRISDLSIITKIDGKEMLMAPVEGIKLRGNGVVTGHKYLKGVGKTSKVVNINSDTCTLKSTRSLYKIVSLSNGYRIYLEDMISELELILKQY